jgi:hypothetical protein
MTDLDHEHIDALVRAARGVLVDFFARPGYCSDENHWWIEQDASGMVEVTVGICDQTFGIAICGFTSYGAEGSSAEEVIEETKQLLARAYSGSDDVRKLLGLAP